MKVPSFHIIAEPTYAIASNGLSFLLHDLGYEKIVISSPDKLIASQKVTYLFLIDECISLPSLNEKIKCDKLILLYSQRFPLSQQHLHELPLKPHALWHLADINTKSLKNVLSLLKQNHQINSNIINQRLQLSPIKMEEYDIHVLKGIAAGLHTDEIAERLRTSKSTIERHKRKIKQQLNNEFITDAGLLNLLYPYGYQFFSLFIEDDSNNAI